MKIILIVFDTVRYDHVSFNGYSRKTTPVLDDLAKDATIFKNCYATDVPTQPSFTSIFTGQRGIKTNIVTHEQPEEMIPNYDNRLPIETFPNILSKNNITTAAVTTLYRFRRWFALGFNHYMQPKIGKPLQFVTCEEVNELAIPWLEYYLPTEKNLFLFLHYWDAHGPYDMAPKKYLEKFYSGDPYDPSNKSLDDLKKRELFYYFSKVHTRELWKDLTDIEYPIAQYDSEINYADDHLSDIIHILEKNRALNDTMIIFTADHGEAFGEHGVYFDHHDAYEQVSHVPLFIWAPGKVRSQTVSSFVQLTDLAPTILESFDLQQSKQMEGSSLWRIIEDGKDEGREFVVTNQGLWSAQRAYRTKEWTIMRTYNNGMVSDAKKWELYKRSEDPQEKHDLSEKEFRIFENMKSAYLKWVDDQLNGRPDPLAIEAERNSATKDVLERYERWLISGKKEDFALKPMDRADIDSHTRKEI